MNVNLAVKQEVFQRLVFATQYLTEAYNLSEKEEALRRSFESFLKDVHTSAGVSVCTFSSFDHFMSKAEEVIDSYELIQENLSSVQIKWMNEIANYAEEVLKNNQDSKANCADRYFCPYCGLEMDRWEDDDPFECDDCQVVIKKEDV